MVRMCGIGGGLVGNLAPVKKIAFIDLEASGLGAASWPIEVGWCFPDSTPETYLIRPAEDWAPEAWDDNAEALHGVSREVLESEGALVADVCRRLNGALGEAEVFSDAPDWDAFWLYRLFTAGGEKQQFPLRSFSDLFHDKPQDEIFAIIEQATATAPHRHRAHDDVLHMKTVYKIATGC